MSFLFSRGNEAVEINEPTGLDFHLTSHGSDWLWAAFSLFALSTLVTVGLSFLKPRTERLFYYTTTFSLFVMSVLYFTMASNLGWTGIQAEFNHVTLDPESSQLESPGIRQIFYARYVGWFLAFSSYILNFAAFSSVPWSTGLFTTVCQAAFVITLLIGSLIKSTYKWGYYVFAVFAFFLVSYNFIFPFRRASADVGLHLSGAIIFGSSILFFMLYLICWALSEGGNVIQPDSEAAFYGVLDVVFFLGVGSYFLFAVRGLDFEQHGINAYDHGVFHKNTHYLPSEATKGPHDRHSGETATDPNAHSAEIAQQQGVLGTSPNAFDTDPEKSVEHQAAAAKAKDIV